MEFNSTLFPTVPDIDKSIADKLLKEHPDWSAKQLADEYVKLWMQHLTDIWE